MSENAFLWSVTASDNGTADPAVPWPENMLPGSVNNSARSTMAGIARLLKDLNGSVATTGSSNAYLATSNSGHTTYTDGILITLKANFSNTAAATINLDSFGAKAVKVIGSGGEADVSAGQIIANGIYQFRYDSAANSAAGAFILLNPAVTVDTGTVRIWTTNTAPTGWLFANGQSVSRTTYAALFAVIGTTYGTADGSSFNVPDLCGRVPVGKDDMGGISAKGRITNAETSLTPTTLGNAGGVQSLALTTAQLASHTHAGTTDGGSSHTHSVNITSSSQGSHTHTVTDPQHSHNTSGNFTTIATAIGTGSAYVGWAQTGGSAMATTSNSTGITLSTEPDHAHNVNGTSGAESSHTHTFTSNATGSGSTHSNLQPSLILNFVIKT